MRGSVYFRWMFKVAGLLAGLLAAMALLFTATQVFAQASKPAVQVKVKSPPFDAGTCYECHDVVKDFHTASAHKTVGCDSCHGGLDTHKAKGKGRPTTNMDPSNCGSCHQNQYRTLYKMNPEKTAHKDKTVATFTTMDKILTPHGFTREHNEPRSHAFALDDHLVVQRKGM